MVCATLHIHSPVRLGRPVLAVSILLLHPPNGRIQYIGSWYTVSKARHYQEHLHKRPDSPLLARNRFHSFQIRHNGLEKRRF